MRHAATLAPGALVLDLACGDGRNAAPLAALGLHVVALDVALAAVSAARRRAPMHALVGDAGALPLGDDVFDVVVVTRFLDRALFPRLASLLRPGGRLLAETFLASAAATRGPRSPDHLLQPGELPRLVGLLAVVEYEEAAEPDGSAVARIVAVRSHAAE